ncbi:MAG: recombinase family protein [Dehalococcoidia bacterium]
MAKSSRNKNKSPQSTGPQRAALYARVSTWEQATEGISIEAQIASLEAWAKMKGYTIVGPYVDAGYSGKDDNRPDFTRMMIDAKRGKFDIVAVAMLDRMMRNLRLLLNCLHDLEECGITFIATHESLDTSTPNGKFSLQIMGVIAEFERERIGERVSEARNYLKSLGKWSGGRAKYGYIWNAGESKFEIVKEQAEVIQHAFDLYVNHNIGITMVAERLNSDGYRTLPLKSRGNAEAKGHLWHSSVIHNLLKDRRYIGEDACYQYPVIISRELFEAAEKKRKNARKIRRQSGNWLLQGRVVCGKCGHSVSPRKRSDRHKRKYECIARRKAHHLDGSPLCTLASVPADELEKMVWRVFARTLTNKSLLQQSIEEAISRLEARQQALGYDATIDQELAKLAGEKERLLDAYQTGTTTRERYMQRVDAVQKKAEKLEIRRDNLNPDSRLEVAKLEDHIKTVRAILADGKIRVDDNGLLLGTFWHDDGKEGLIPEDYDLFDLWEGKEPDLEAEDVEVTTGIMIGPDGKEVSTMEIHPSEKEMADFEHRDEIYMERKRKLLEKFNIKVVAYPDRIEIRGLLPIQTFRNMWGQVSKTAI